MAVPVPGGTDVVAPGPTHQGSGGWTSLYSMYWQLLLPHAAVVYPPLNENGVDLA
jgi:hypothetical protein